MALAHFVRKHLKHSEENDLALLQLEAVVVATNQHNIDKNIDDNTVAKRCDIVASHTARFSVYDLFGIAALAQLN